MNLYRTSSNVSPSIGLLFHTDINYSRTREIMYRIRTMVSDSHATSYTRIPTRRKLQRRTDALRDRTPQLLSLAGLYILGLLLDYSVRQNCDEEIISTELILCVLLQQTQGLVEANGKRNGREILSRESAWAVQNMHRKRGERAL